MRDLGVGEWQKSGDAQENAGQPIDGIVNRTCNPRQGRPQQPLADLGHRITIRRVSQRVHDFDKERGVRCHGCQARFDPGRAGRHPLITEATDDAPDQLWLLSRQPLRADTAADERPVDLVRCQAERLDVEHDGRDQLAVCAAGLNVIVPPDDLEDDVVIAGIEVMAVLGPAPGAQVQLDAAMLGPAVVDRDDRVAEVWTEAVRPCAEVDDIDGAAVCCRQQNRARQARPGAAKVNLGNRPGACPAHQVSLESGRAGLFAPAPSIRMLP